MALLRTTEQDGRKPLVRQALDVLAPALTRRLPSPGPSERFPIWVRYTKKARLCFATDAVQGFLWCRVASIAAPGARRPSCLACGCLLSPVSDFVHVRPGLVAGETYG